MKYALVVLTLLLSIGLAVPASAQTQYPNGYSAQPQGWHGVLSPEDQQQFDKYYAKWVNDTRKNDRDDIASDAQHMQNIMMRYNIPISVSFDQVASMTGQGAYPNGAYAATYPAYGQTRLSPDDQREFDNHYTKWLEAQRKNDIDDVDKNARKMQEIMARNNIPLTVAYAAIATNGYAAAPNANAYPYGYAQPARTLSAKDQSDFDHYYHEWIEAKHKKHVGDIDKNAQKMQEIMARYNIPANVSFDRVASGEPYR